jgi:uncharacterized protein YndB with AHSA1/START domain
MPDIFHDLFVRADPRKVFDVVSTPAGLDEWWTKRSSGKPSVGSTYELWFGPEYDWRASVTRCDPDVVFELEVTDASDDWNGTKVRFELEARTGGTTVRFSHRGWRNNDEHFRESSYCWATYLRIMKRYLENEERVPYESRDDA